MIWLIDELFFINIMLTWKQINLQNFNIIQPNINQNPFYIPQNSQFIPEIMFQQHTLQYWSQLINNPCQQYIQTCPIQWINPIQNTMFQQPTLQYWNKFINNHGQQFIQRNQKQWKNYNSYQQKLKNINPIFCPSYCIPN